MASSHHVRRLGTGGVRAHESSRGSWLGGSIAIIGILCAQPGEARADASPADRAAAQALFEQGKKLLAGNAAAEACPKLEESQRLDPGIGTQFHLADCYERIGRTASAWSTFLEVAAAAKAADQGDRERAARKRAAALEPKLSHLKITVPPEVRVQGLEVKREGAVIGAAQWDVAVPVDPGTYRIVATAPGRKASESTAAVRGPSGSATVVLAALEPAATDGAAVAPAPLAAPEAGPRAAAPRGEQPLPPTTRSQRFDARTRRTMGFITGGAGLVGLGIGGFFGVRSMMAKSDAQDHCKGSLCDAEGVDLRDDAIVSGTVSTVGFVTGTVLLAGGAVLVLTARQAPDRTTGSRAAAAGGSSIAIGMGPGALTARGQW